MKLEYDDGGIGNIKSKSGISSNIAYGANAGPHALTSVTDPPGLSTFLTPHLIK